jgi:hypothetical protein
MIRRFDLRASAWDSRRRKTAITRADSRLDARGTEDVSERRRRVSSAAIVVLADTETKEDLGRVVNAMITAKEFKEAGDDVAIVFDGAGTKWIPELSDGHRYSDLFGAVRDKVAGACEYCSKAYGVLEGVEQAGVELLGEYEHHPSLHGYASQGYQVVTF